MILIYPPVAKPCEPPAGIARLSGMLGSLGVEHCLLDANLEGLLYLFQSPMPEGKAGDTWTRRAIRNRDRNLSYLRDPALYCNLDRYRRAVRDMTRALAVLSPSGTMVGLADYGQEGLSPLRSSDLLTAAEQHALNPFYPYFRPRLEQLFQEKKPSVVGISLNYLSQALPAFSMAGFIRREFPGITIILGGGLVTSWVRNPGWKNPFSGLVDHLVAGPGEDRFLSLLGLTAGIKKTWRPDYAGLPAGRYLSPGFILPYSASSGCYWGRCDFCPEKAEKNVYAPIPSRQVIADLKAMRKDSDPALIHLLDNAVSPALLEALSSEPIGAPWYGFARISEYLTDPDVCRALKRSGCVMLKLGIESGAQDVLDRLEKGISVRTASMVLKNLKRAGIASYVYLLFGTPVETETSARKTLDFAVQHHECINFLNLAIFNMPVCGQAGQGIERKNFYDGDLSLYTDFVHPQGWDRRQVRLFLDDTFRKHPSISSILRNEPPVFTSNHAAFLVMNEKERK